MTPDGSTNPALSELRARGQGLLAELAGFHEAVAKQLAGQQDGLARAAAAHQELEAKLAQAATARQQLEASLAEAATAHRELQAKLEAVQTAETQRTAELKALHASHAIETKKLNDQLAALTADNEALQAFQLQWAAEREGHLKDKEELASRHAELNQQLNAVSEENNNLKELHSRVTSQASSLVNEWSSKRQALAADNERLKSEAEQAKKALDQSRQREKDWQAQVYRLQDELKQLREAAGRMTLSDEQSHHLLSQLNAIIGFAEVLMDESGNRATGEERAEFLHDIKDSGAHLADYVNQISAAEKDVQRAGALADDADVAPVAANWAARTVIVATTDATVRERTQAFLSKAGYQVEYANDAEETVKMALQLKPLAIMVDADLPPKGAQAVVDDLQHEARTRDIPVVLMGAHGDEPLELTIDRYDLLSKPINRQQMLQLMVKYDLLADRRRVNKMPTSVLVIDDDARNTRLVKAMLKPYAVSVLEADGGAAGIKVAQRSKPELIILDLMMPDVDGFQVVSTLRNDPATSHIPILIYTAKNITAEDRRRLQASIQSIVRKGDLSKEQFLELVYRRGERRNMPPAVDAAA